jgi:Ulp1 family protease
MKRILKKALPEHRTLNSYRHLLIPVNRCHSHWLTLAIDLHQHTIIVIDSIRNKLASYDKDVLAL